MDGNHKQKEQNIPFHLQMTSHFGWEHLTENVISLDWGSGDGWSRPMTIASSIEERILFRAHP